MADPNDPVTRKLNAISAGVFTIFAELTIVSTFFEEGLFRGPWTLHHISSLLQLSAAAFLVAVQWYVGRTVIGRMRKSASSDRRDSGFNDAVETLWVPIEGLPVLSSMAIFCVTLALHSFIER